MSNSLLVSTKIRGAINNGKAGSTIVRRALAVIASARSRRVSEKQIYPARALGVKLRSNDRANFFSLPISDNFSTRTNVDSENILESPFESLGKFTGIFLHDLVWENLDRWHDKTALVCSATGRSYTYAQLRKSAGRLASSLRKMNLRPGERIAAILPNVPEYAVLILGASEAGIGLTVINPAYTVREIRTQLESSRASTVFTVPSKYPMVAEASSLRWPVVVVEDGSGPAAEGAINFRHLVRDDVEELGKTAEKIHRDSEDTFLLPYSSGTSGLPKGVELSHRNIVANLMQSRAKGVSFAMEATADQQEIVPLILPIFHIYGLVVCLLQYLCLGAKIVCMPQFTPDNLLKLLEDHRSTLLYVAPPLVQLLANEARLKKSHLETIKTVMSGAAPIGEEALAKFLTRTPPSSQMLQGYGLTECSPVISLAAGTPFLSTGYLVPNTQVRIVGYESENEGRNLGANEVGEIYVKGPQVMKGYYKNPQATKDCMEGDWFKTGDLGCYDENGLMYIRGRLKELIKVQGYQVAPAEIEDTIQGHEKVVDAAVIGVPHEKYGEIPKAFVVAKEGASLDPNEIKNWVAERLVKYKHLGYVQFVDKIPKSAAGKILRRELAKM